MLNKTHNIPVPYGTIPKYKKNNNVRMTLFCVYNLKKLNVFVCCRKTRRVAQRFLTPFFQIPLHPHFYHFYQHCLQRKSKSDLCPFKIMNLSFNPI